MKKTKEEFNILQSQAIYQKVKKLMHDEVVTFYNNVTIISSDIEYLYSKLDLILTSKKILSLEDQQSLSDNFNDLAKKIADIKPRLKCFVKESMKPLNITLKDIYKESKKVSKSIKQLEKQDSIEQSHQILEHIIHQNQYELIQKLQQYKKIFSIISDIESSVLYDAKFVINQFLRLLYKIKSFNKFDFLITQCELSKDITKTAFKYVDTLDKYSDKISKLDKQYNEIPNYSLIDNMVDKITMNKGKEISHIK